MRYDLVGHPGAQAARLRLALGEAVRVGSASIAAVSQGLAVESGFVGGLGKAIARALGGESTRQTVVLARLEEGEVLLGPVPSGEIVALELREDAYVVAEIALVAADCALRVHTRSPVRGFYGRGRRSLVRVSGSGTLLLAAFGSVAIVELGMDQSYWIDTDHVVAFTDSTEPRMRRRSWSVRTPGHSHRPRIAEFCGPAVLYLQTRSPVAFAEWSNALAPRGKSGAGPHEP